MHKADVNLKNPRLAKPLGSGSQPTGVHSTRTEEGLRESIRILGMNIAQTAVQGIGMSTKDPWGPPLSVPQYALAVSLIFTKATNQTIILGTPPEHVLSTSILWSSLAHDKRFEQVPMSEAAPGDIIIGSGWQTGADGYAGIVVDHGRIVSNSSNGVQDNSSLLEIQRHHPEMVAFRYVGFWNFYRSKSLANEGFDPNEPRLPAGQPGGGQWTGQSAARPAPAPTPRPQQRQTNQERTATGNEGDNDSKTVGQAAKETAKAFLSGLASILRGILFPSEPDREPSKPKSLMQLAKEVDEAADNIDMTKPKGLGHAMAAGAAIAAGEAVSEGSAGSSAERSGPETGEGALPDAGGPGAAEKLIYEPNPKHPPAGSVAPGEGSVAPAPTNPQEALDHSVPYDANSPARVAVEPKSGEFVIFRPHAPGRYHGYAVTWDQLTQPQKNALIKSGQVNVRGKIL